MRAGRAISASALQSMSSVCACCQVPVARLGGRGRLRLRGGRTAGYHGRILSPLAIALVCALLLLRSVDLMAAEPRRILLIHPFTHPFSPWSDVAASVREELVKTSS